MNTNIINLRFLPYYYFVIPFFTVTSCFIIYFIQMNRMLTAALKGMISLLTIFPFQAAFAQKPVLSAPPDQPAEIRISGKQIEISYNRQIIFKGAMNADKK